MTRIGIWGLFGSGNIGNDGTLEAVIAELQRTQPDATIDVMCLDPEPIVRTYGLSATRQNWNIHEYETAASPTAIVRKGLGKIADVFRTSAWVRRHDVVIVPGTGVLEATLPLRPWGFPYSMFLVCIMSRLLGVQLAFISVGADTNGSVLTRWLQTRAAGLATYRSYRDILSRDAMAGSGLDVSNDHVFPDLAFALPEPSFDGATKGVVGLGVIAYRGTNDERQNSSEVYANYIAKIQRFARWLVDHDYQIRLLIGDLQDQQAAKDVIDDVLTYRPDLDPSWIVDRPISSLFDLMREISRVDTVVATRYHNVLCALKLIRPTVSIGYADKNHQLMREFGLDQYCQAVGSLDVERLVDQFSRLESQREQLRESITNHTAEVNRQLDRQSDLLSATIFATNRSRQLS